MASFRSLSAWGQAPQSGRVERGFGVTGFDGGEHLAGQSGDVPEADVQTGMPEPEAARAGAETSVAARLQDMSRLLRHRSVRFAIVGVTATLMHASVLGLLSGAAGLEPVAANTLAIIAASMISYFGHRSFTFQMVGGNHVKSTGKFLAQFAGSWAVSSATAALLIPVLGAWPVAILIAIMIPCLNYFVYARWTFK